MTVPMPDTCSPGLVYHADRVRKSIFPRTVVFIQPPNFNRVVDYGEAAEPVPKIVLQRYTACGLAPFVGDYRHEDAMYYWDYHMDHTGEYYVAGEAHLQFQPIFPPSI